jgi:hypothetical protein
VGFVESIGDRVFFGCERRKSELAASGGPNAIRPQDAILPHTGGLVSGDTPGSYPSVPGDLLMAPGSQTK